MAHLPPEILPADAGFSKTVFMAFNGTDAVMVTQRAGKFSKREMKFADTHAALSWCESHQANFYCAQPSHPAKN